MYRIISYIRWGVCMLSLTGLCFFFVTYFFSCNGKQTPIESAKPVFVENTNHN
jgi:hypothetical protein